MPAVGLFLVIYIAGDVAGRVGPLPYGWQECRVRIVEMMITAGFQPDMKFACEYHRRVR